MKWLAVTVIVLFFLVLPFLIYSGEDQGSVGPADPAIQEFEVEPRNVNLPKPVLR